MKARKVAENESRTSHRRDKERPLARVTPPAYGISIIDRAPGGAQRMVSGRGSRRIAVHASPPSEFQSKLKVNAPGDANEQEAERVAGQVMRILDRQTQSVRASDNDGSEHLEDVNQSEQMLSTKRGRENDPGRTVAPPIIQEVLRSPGRPLDPATKRFFQPRFGHDFGRVRVHTDAAAALSARALGAEAYTLGQDMVFAKDRYAPETNHGRRLLAHELAHVMQQSYSGPSVQRYTSYSSGDQIAGNSLGWVHPGSENIRISDDGLMGVEDKRWNPGSNKRAWTTKAKITESNAKLKNAGSNAKLVEKVNKISGKPPDNPKAKDRELVEIEPRKAIGSGVFTLISDCGSAARQVMGSSGGKDVAVMERSGIEIYTAPRTYHGGNPTTPEEFFEDILGREFGKGFARTERYDKYSNLSTAKKDALDRKYGINMYAIPDVGQGQTISTEKDMPGFAATGPMTWNFHYAATVLRSGADHVTLESAAGWGATDWIFYMYGPAKKAQSFHEEHGAMGSHGTEYTTMVVQSEKRLKGKTSTPGVHLVGDPAKWDTTLIVKLPDATEVYTLKRGRNWRRVRVKTGPHSGKTGWMMNRYFSE